MSLLTFAQATFRWEFIWESRAIFMDGLRLTILISIVAFTLSTVLGLVVALLRMSKNRIIAPLIAAYVNVFRAIPLLVFILFVYYGIAIQFNLAITAIQAVPHGQREAALSVGMGRVQTFFRVILPQAIRIVIPPTGNMFIGMVKDSSLVYLIGVPELLRVSNRLANRTFRYFEVYAATVLIYLVLTTAIYFGVKYLERRYALVDILTAKTRSWSPFAARKAARLRDLQASVREVREAGGTLEEDFAEHTDVESPKPSASANVYEEEGSTHS